MSADNDGLHWPVSFDAKYGAGTKKSVVFGGGGVFLLAWYVGYYSALKKSGVDLADAELLVGTSAGSQLVGWVPAHQISEDDTAEEWFPRLQAMGFTTGATGFPSQLRVLKAWQEAKDNSPESIRSVGFAALASHGPLPEEVRRVFRSVLGFVGWPSDGIRICTVDAYTAERLVITSKAGVELAHAVACSAAAPESFRPQPIFDRWCLDGAVSGSNWHCDTVGGTERALVLALEGNADPTRDSAARMTFAQGAGYALHQEVKGLEASGTQVLLKGPRSYDDRSLMDPDAVPGAWQMAQEQAAEDLDEIRQFWIS